MTRENKLALIVGFGLVLFVGILVSDHLSTARRHAAAPLHVGPAHQSTLPIAMGDGWLVYGGEQADPTQRTPNRQHASTPRRHQPPAAPPDTIPIDNGLRNSPHYVVANGDTLRSICQRHYGDPNLDRALAAYNRLPNPDRLTPQTRLLLPSIDLLHEQSSPGQDGLAPPTPTTTMATYTVKKGDTLSQLAQQLLGSARDTQRLYELNRDVLSSRDDVRIGAVLRYPTQPLNNR